MRQSTLFRFLIIGILVAFGLGLTSFIALRELNESSTAEVRRNMILFVAQALENGAPYKDAIQALHSRSGHRYSAASLWVFSNDGTMLASNIESPPPVAWQNLSKPVEIHDFVFHYGFLRLIPDVALVRLEANPKAYLLIEFRRPGSAQSGVWVQVAFVFFIIGVSVLIAIALMYVYLRRKSEEARAVLSRLEKGDLQARFEIKRVDEIGSLMVDFNRMASEIERLVHRVFETEKARKNLLEELSHDLRTPLTSLKTSAETLSDHWSEMPPETQWEFVSVIRSELGYFLNLIEDLFFIASIGEPRYKNTTQQVDLISLLSDEIKKRETAANLPESKSKRKITWELHCDPSAKTRASVLGDPLLIQRLFKNALDNAAQHAESRVTTEILPQDQSVSVFIANDGKEISDEDITSFGSRRKNRFQPDASKEGVSLGLGSVIMRTILELHGGTFSIRRREVEKQKGPGTVLSLLLPKNPSESEKTS